MTRNLTFLTTGLLIAFLFLGILSISNALNITSGAYADSNVYIYGVEEYSNTGGYLRSKMVLYSSDGSSGVWTSSQYIDGEYTQTGTEGASLDLGSTNVAGWYKFNNGDPIRVMNIYYDDFDGEDECMVGGRIAVAVEPFENSWMITDQNQNIAYAIFQNRVSNETCVIALGKYVVPDKVDDSYDGRYSGQTVWINTAVGSAWQIITSTEAHPETIADNDERRATFDEVTELSAEIKEDGVTFHATLDENDKAISVRADVAIGSSNATKSLFGNYYSPDYAAANAVLYSNTSLKYVYSIAAPDDAEATIKAQAPAFAFSSIDNPELLAIGNNEETSQFTMNKAVNADYSYATYNNVSDVVVGITETDLRLCASWVDRNPGDVVSFTINAGPAASMVQFNSPIDKVEELIDEIGTVEYTPASKAKIDAARDAYDGMAPAYQALVSNYNDLTEAETIYAQKEAEANTPATPDPVPDQGGDSGSSSGSESTPSSDTTPTPAPAPAPEDTVSQPGKGINGGAVAGIVIGAIVVLACAAYLLLFFAFNKFIIKDDKVVRAFILSKKDEDIKLITFKCGKEVREKEKVFATKKEAEDSLKKE